MTIDIKTRFEEIVKKELESITLKTINKDNLGNDLSEEDLDIILCIQKEYSKELTLEEKKEKVTEILEKINNKKKKKKKTTTLENEILELALQSRLHAEKAQKKKELISEFSKSFAGLILKNDIKEAKLVLIAAKIPYIIANTLLYNT